MTDFFDVPDGVDKIDIRKKISKIMGEAKQAAKPTNCIMCGTLTNSFCNSHSVPQLSLKQIADNGKVLHASAAMGFDYELLTPSKGINSSGTFNFICRNCDGTFFQDYENEGNLLQYPSDKMLAEIAVKNILLQLSKRHVEIKINEILKRKHWDTFTNVEQLIYIEELDVAEYEKELFFHKQIADQKTTGCYQILFWNILPYKVPIAMQSAICMLKDLEGLQINDLYNMDAKDRMQYLHLCILPLNGKSVIIAFYHKRDKKYRRLRHQFNAMSEADKLMYLNYLIFEYAENYFISKRIQSEIETNPNIQKLSTEYNQHPELGLLSLGNSYGVNYSPVKMSEIPNFLASEWAI